MSEVLCPYCGGEMRHVATSWSDAEYYECKGCHSRSPSANCMKVKEAALTRESVPVVRCKDCKNRGTPYNCPMRKLVMPFQGAGSYEDCTEDEGFCHMGVKKDGGADDE